MNRGTALVVIQLGLFVAYCFDFSQLSFSVPELIRWLGWGGGLLGGIIIGRAVGQLNTNLSPFPKPKASGELIDTGLYAWVRHPIYTGIMVGSIMYAIGQGSGWKLLVAVVLTALFHYKAHYEERLLCAHFDQYPEYTGRTGRFFPTMNE